VKDSAHFTADAKLLQLILAVARRNVFLRN
jgi:hypothetical protein